MADPSLVDTVPDNPFTAKATRNNPFTAKAERKPNPFTTRADTSRATKLAELDTMVEQAEERYVNSLDKALRSGVSRQQVNKLFNVSDRHMHTLISLGKQRNRLLNGDRPSQR
jgi:hypothetical protein